MWHFVLKKTTCGSDQEKCCNLCVIAKYRKEGYLKIEVDGVCLIPPMMT